MSCPYSKLQDKSPKIHEMQTAKADAETIKDSLKAKAGQFEKVFLSEHNAFILSAVSLVAAVIVFFRKQIFKTMSKMKFSLQSKTSKRKISKRKYI